MQARSRRIWLALGLAAGFVLFRLGYAFIFSGLSGNQVILDLPTLSLPGPFRMVNVLGPVSVDGIVRSIETALPFAAAIVLFGVAGSFVGPKQLARLAERFPRLSWITTALAVGLGTIPNLAAAISELRAALRLRGEKRFAILVPLLERTVERSRLIGLELARSKPLAIAPANLEVRNLSFGPLGPISFTLSPGSIMLLTGATGSGKSSLLSCLAGEAHEDDLRRCAGEIQLGTTMLSSFASASAVSHLVHQHPQGRFIEDVVLETGSFSSALMGKPVAMLSHGEAYRFALDNLLRRSPQVVLIDEPSSALDAAGLELLATEIAEIAATGKIVIIAEHRPKLLSSLATHSFHLDRGKLVEGDYASEPTQKVRRPAIPPGRDVTAEIHLSKLSTDRILLSSVNLELTASECVAVTGPNGAGKSTLLASIAMGRSVDVVIHGRPFDGFDPNTVAYVPDRAGSFFVSGALGKELQRADKIAGAAAGLTRLTLESILGKDIEKDLETHPLDLSVGTQLALATAMQLSHKPALILIDEPAQGLDPNARELMAETIRCVQETGCAVLFASHDRDFAGAIANRVMHIDDAELRELIAGRSA